MRTIHVTTAGTLAVGESVAGVDHDELTTDEAVNEWYDAAEMDWHTVVEIQWREGLLRALLRMYDGTTYWTPWNQGSATTWVLYVDGERYRAEPD